MKNNTARLRVGVLCVAGAMAACCGGAHAQHYGDAHLTPLSPTDSEPSFNMKALEEGVYEVWVDKEGYVGEKKYVLNGAPQDKQTGNHTEFFVWKKTASSESGTQYYFKFEVCNTHLEPADSKTRVDCTWVYKEGGGPGGGGGGADIIPGWAEGNAIVKTNGPYWIEASPPYAGVGAGIGVTALAGNRIPAVSDWEIISGEGEFEEERYTVSSVSVVSDKAGPVVVWGEYCMNRDFFDTKTLTFVEVVSISAEPDVVCAGATPEFTVVTNPEGEEYKGLVSINYDPDTPGTQDVVAVCGTSAATCTVTVVKMELTGSTSTTRGNNETYTATVKPDGLNPTFNWKFTGGGASVQKSTGTTKTWSGLMVVSGDSRASP